MIKTITQHQYLQLVGLLALAKQHNRDLERIKCAAMEITGDDDEWGLTSDAVYGMHTIDELLKFLEIAVEETDEKESHGN